MITNRMLGVPVDELVPPPELPPQAVRMKALKMIEKSRGNFFMELIHWIVDWIEGCD
jgi:hypothetical protein